MSETEDLAANLWTDTRRFAGNGTIVGDKFYKRFIDWTDTEARKALYEGRLDEYLAGKEGV